MCGCTTSVWVVLWHNSLVHNMNNFILVGNIVHINYESNYTHHLCALLTLSFTLSSLSSLTGTATTQVLQDWVIIVIIVLGAVILIVIAILVAALACRCLRRSKYTEHTHLSIECLCYASTHTHTMKHPPTGCIHVHTFTLSHFCGYKSKLLCDCILCFCL